MKEFFGGVAGAADPIHERWVVIEKSGLWVPEHDSALIGVRLVTVANRRLDPIRISVNGRPQREFPQIMAADIGVAFRKFVLVAKSDMVEISGIMPGETLIVGLLENRGLQPTNEPV